MVLKLGVAPLALLAGQNVALAQTFDWSGVYVGGLIGMSNDSSDTSIDYTNDDGSPPEGWVNGEFHGDVYNAADSMNVSGPGATNNDIPDLTDWPTAFPSEDSRFIGTLLAGASMQNGNLVFGGELRATFGSFGASESNAWSTGGPFNGSVDFEGPNSFTYSDPNNVLTGTLPTSVKDYTSVFEGISYSGIYNQDNTLNVGAKFNSMFSPVARFGVAMDRVLFFAMAGPAYAKVKANTSASIHETIFEGVVDLEFDSADSFAANETYNFSGSNSKGMWGYTIGGGAEFAATDNVIIRVEGEFHDLGSISVTGESPDTLATYTVNQDLSGFSVSTGVILKF